MTSPRFPTWKSGFPDNSTPARNRQISLSYHDLQPIHWIDISNKLYQEKQKHNWISNRSCRLSAGVSPRASAYPLTDQAALSIYSYRIGLSPITHACELGYLQRHSSSLGHATPLLKCWIYRKIPTHLHRIWPECGSGSHPFLTHILRKSNADFAMTRRPAIKRHSRCF